MMRKTCLGLLALVALGGQARAQTLATIFRFNGRDGAAPIYAPVTDGEGNLYGTTGYGGGSGACGTLYKLTPGVSRSFETLHTFIYAEGCPKAGPTYDKSTDTIYGTTEGGHSHQGTVFSYDLATGAFNEYPLPNGRDFLTPSGLTLGSDGALYGTNEEIEGTQCSPAYVCSDVFKFDPATGSTTTVHILSLSEGGETVGDLVFGKAGQLFGVTTDGGAPSVCGCGTVYRLDPVTGATQVIYNFTRSMTPVGLAVDDDKNLYVTTYYGGDHNSGEIIKLTPNVGEPYAASTIFQFGSATAGGYPNAPLTYDSVKKVLYGTSSVGGTGSDGEGVLFQINPDGSNFMVLHAFAGGSDGATPNDTVLVSLGELYGETLGTELGVGGLRYCQGPCGTLFKYPRF